MFKVKQNCMCICGLDRANNCSRKAADRMYNIVLHAFNKYSVES